MKTRNEVSVPNGCRQLPKETRTSTKRYTMTRITNNNYHFTKDSSTTGPDAPQVDNSQTEEPIKCSQATTDASLVAPPQSNCSENAANGKKRPHRKTSTPKTEVQPLTATLLLNKNHRMLYLPLQLKQYEICVLVDAGAKHSALSKNELGRITTARPNALLDELAAPDYRIQIANGNFATVRKQILLRLFLAGRLFGE